MMLSSGISFLTSKTAARLAYAHFACQRNREALFSLWLGWPASIRASEPGYADIMIGGASLPSLLHQDPHYFYQGTGTKTSRFLHAISNPFVCRGDNGHLQANYSSLGGDLASAAISNAYYPQSNRGAGLVLGNFAIGTAERVVSSLAQEFLFRRFTTKAPK